MNLSLANTFLCLVLLIAVSYISRILLVYANANAVIWLAGSLKTQPLVYTCILKQWIALKARTDWLVKFWISLAIYLQATRETEMASRFASVTSEEIIQIRSLWLCNGGRFCPSSKYQLKLSNFIIFNGVYYLTVLVHTKTTIHLSVGG